MAEEQLTLVHDPERCTACMMCAIACSLKHLGTPDVSKSLRFVTFDPVTGKARCAYCAHCEHPACEAACPTSSIYKDPETGWVLKNQAVCIGCKNCVYACPYSIPRYDESMGITWKCDFCGGEPECARVCPTGATRVVARSEARRFYAERLEVKTSG